ncbi:MAG TPA: TIGR04282 family arsenosugar biosynthesis glycosyltransferase [Alphaproteobacteria bacterium]|nr:TIGR04282 family arsenosugar biosynthesis glycosyltransferase [Alphaproteobacteria bacterium]
MTRTLIVFARAPQLGRVKQRLARGIGPGAALAFYRRTLATVLRRLARDRRWRTLLAVTPDRAAGSARLWPLPLPRAGQGRGDLGARMARSLGRTRGPVCIVGADIPDLDARHVWRAFRALGRCEFVFGPAADGGYWLIGARTRLPYALFAQVRWSTPHALADTLAGLKSRRVAFAEILADVDDEDAYRGRRGG